MALGELEKGRVLPIQLEQTISIADVSAGSNPEKQENAKKLLKLLAHLTKLGWEVA